MANENNDGKKIFEDIKPRLILFSPDTLAQVIYDTLKRIKAETIEQAKKARADAAKKEQAKKQED